MEHEQDVTSTACGQSRSNVGLGGFLVGNGKPDLLLSNLRTIGTHHCDGTVGEEAAQEIERLREAIAEMQKRIASAWNDGFDFARKGCGWQEGEDPATEGLYVARDSKGNTEVGMWFAKTTNGQPAEWSKEFRDVDRDDIVAWMMVPPNVEVTGAEPVGEASGSAQG